MKIVVLVPSEEYKRYAGARIRYARMAGALAERGFSLALQSIGDFEPQAADADIVFVSKCHDARSLVVAALLSASGRLVGVDLFDDYFSQAGDSRLTRYRNWLAQLLPNCHFALCSTEAMAGVVREYRSDVPVHLVHDPAPEIDALSLAATVERKLGAARDAKCIRVAWFGVGDNPHFHVGLHDVAAFAGQLRAFRRTGMAVELDVMTNSRALTAAGLAQLASLDLPTRVEEWTEKGEESLLKDALIVYLPVNFQGFSTAKSLNRAVTGLAAGCQILSVGYPLYGPLHALIYRGANVLADDIATGDLRLSPARMDLLEGLIGSFASAATEAERLSQFLNALSPSTAADARLALVHGYSTNERAAEMVEAAGGLTVATPSTPASVVTDVIFRWAVDQLNMLVSEAAARSLRPGLKNRLEPAGNIHGRQFLELPGRGPQARMPKNPVEPSPRSLAAQLSTYQRSIDEIGRRMNDAFGPCRIILSENSPLPFSAET